MLSNQIFFVLFSAQTDKVQDVLGIKLVYFSYRYSVTYVKPSGEKITVKGKDGDTLLDTVVNNNVDLEGFGKYLKKLIHRLVMFIIF